MAITPGADSVPPHRRQLHQPVGRLSLAWFYRIGNIAAQRGVGSPKILLHALSW